MSAASSMCAKSARRSGALLIKAITTSSIAFNFDSFRSTLFGKSMKLSAWLVGVVAHPAYRAEGFSSSGFIGTTTGVHAGSFAASLSHTSGVGGSGGFFSSANRRLHGKKICLIQGSQHHSTRLCTDE
jgi:hypothetical protein